MIDKLATPSQLMDPFETTLNFKTIVIASVAMTNKRQILTDVNHDVNQNIHSEVHFMCYLQT